MKYGLGYCQFMIDELPIQSQINLSYSDLAQQLHTLHSNEECLVMGRNHQINSHRGIASKKTRRRGAKPAKNNALKGVSLNERIKRTLPTIAYKITTTITSNANEGSLPYSESILEVILQFLVSLRNTRTGQYVALYLSIITALVKSKKLTFTMQSKGTNEARINTFINYFTSTDEAVKVIAVKYTAAVAPLLQKYTAEMATYDKNNSAKEITGAQKLVEAIERIKNSEPPSIFPNVDESVFRENNI